MVKMSHWSEEQMALARQRARMSPRPWLEGKPKAHSFELDREEQIMLALQRPESFRRPWLERQRKVHSLEVDPHNRMMLLRQLTANSIPRPWPEEQQKSHSFEFDPDDRSTPGQLRTKSIHRPWLEQQRKVHSLELDPDDQMQDQLRAKMVHRPWLEGQRKAHSLELDLEEQIVLARHRVKSIRRPWLERQRKVHSFEGISSLLPSHNAKQDDDSGSQDEQDFIMRSAQNGSNPDGSRRRQVPVDDPKRSSYQGETNRRSPPSLQRSRFPSSPEPAHGNGLMVPFDRPGSVSSEHDSFATPPTSMPNSRETSPTGVPDRAEPTAKPSQRVQPFPNQGYRRPGQDDSQTASDTQDIAPASSGSSSPKIWHVNPLQQSSERKKSRSPSSRGKVGNKAKLVQVPSSATQNTDHPRLQSPSSRQEHPLVRQGSLPGRFEQQNSSQSQPVPYTPPPQLKHQQSNQRMGSPVQRSRGVLTRHFSSDNAVSLAQAPPSPQHTARGRHYSVGDHRSAFSPPDRKQQLTKQLSLQEDLVHYENGERYRYPDIKSRNQPPPPPPQRSSSHVWSRQISGHPWSPPPQCLSPDFFHSHLAKDAMTSVSQPAGLPLTHSASQPSFAQDGLTYSQPVQSPALQQAQPPSSPSQQGFVPPNLYAMHPNQQLYYQLQQQHQQHHQQPQLQPAPMYYAKQQSLPLVQTEEGQIQQVYQGYATQPQSDQFPPEQAPLLQEGIYQQRERDPSNSPPQGYNYPSDTAHSSTSSSRYDSETIAANERRPLLSNYTCNSTSTTTTTTTTSPDPNNDTLFYLVTKDSRSEVKQRPPYRSSREEMTQQPRESQNDYVPARGPEEDDAFYINSDALLKDERVRRGRSPGRNDPAWEDHIRRRERRRDELIRSSSQEREERQPQGQRASSSEKVTNSEQEYTSVPASPRRKSRHSRSGSQSPQGQRSSRNQRHESPSPRPKSKVSGSKEKLARSKSSEIPEYANVPLQKKYKSKRKEKQSDEEPVYANVPIKGDKRRQRSNSSPSSITRQLEVPPDEPPEYVNVPLRYDRISKSAANWKEQYVLEYVQKSSDPDLVKRRPPASPKKPERESPVPRRAQESLVQKKKTDSLHKDSSLKERSLSPPTRRADSPRFSPRRKSDESRPWHKRRQSPSPVRRERPRSFEGDQEDRQVDDLHSQRPKSVHEELLMPGVVPAAIEYLRTRRGRGSARSIQEHHPRSQSVGRVERSHNDLCYSTSNLEHYARDTTDIRDTLPRSWGMEMFARRRRDPELFPDSLELHTRDGFTNQAYIPDTLGRHGSESQERSRLRRHGSYEDALELGLISTSSSSPERPPKSPTKLGGNDSQLYYVYGTEQNIPNVLSNYYGKKPARHRRSEDFERALQELDDMYAKLNLETDDLYRPSRSDGYRRTKSTEIPLHSVPRIPVGKMHKNEAPSQKAKRRAQRERPHSYTAGLTTSEDSGDQFHLQEKLRQVKSPNKHKAELPKYEKIASKVRYRAPEYDMTSSEDEYNDKQLVRKSKSHAAVFRRPEAYKKGGRSSDSSPSPERVSLRTRSQSADDFVPQPESKVKFQEPPQRPYGKVVIPSDLSISQDDSPPHGRGRVGEKKDNRELEELYNASGLHPRMVWITDSDSMSVQRGSTEQQVSTSELDEEIPRDEGEPIAGNAKTGKPVQGGEPVTGVTGEAAEQSEPKPVYIRNVRVFHRAKVESVEETQEKRKSLLDDPSIPLADGSEGEDEEVKALMQPSFEESKVDKEKTMKDPSSPGSARRREFLEAGDKSPRKTYQHLVERKHPGSTYQKSVREVDGGDEEMSRTVSKLRERITSEKPLATSAERRRALFGDTGRSSSNPGNQKKSESDIIGWNEQSRNVDSDSDRSTSGRYWRHRTKDESEKRYQRLTADRSYDRDLSYRRRLDSDSSDTSRGEGRVDYNRKGSTASVDGHSRLSPSHGISDTGRGSKSFDYDLGRHSHLDNNYKTSTGITPKYSDDGLTDKTSDTKYGKNYDRDVRSSRKALLDDGSKESDQRAPTPTDSVRSNRTLQEDRLRSPTRQEFDRNSPIRRSRDYNLDVGSRSSTRTRVDKYDEDLDIYNRYARTRDAGVSERTKDLPDRTSKLTERDSDLSRKERKAKEVPDTSHITSNGEISHPTAEDTLSSRVQPSRSSRDADTTSAVGALTAKHGSGQVSSDSSEDSDARAKRIAEYKDKRRKELAQKYGIADDLDLKADSSTRKFKYANRRSNTDLGLTSDTLKRAEDLIAKSKDRKGSDSSTLQSRPTNDESGKPEDTDYSYLRKKYGLDRDRDRTADTTATTSKDVDSAPSRSSRSASLRGDKADGSLSQRSPRVVSPVAKETGSDETAAGRATSPRLRQTEESSFDRYTEARLSRRRLRREGSDVTSPVATEVVSKTESPRTEMSPAERRSLRARSAPFQERPSARRTAADAREVPQRVPEREPLDSVSATRTVPSHSQQVKTTTRDAITQRVPSVGEQTVGTGRRSRSIVEAERASVEPPSPGETRTFTRPLEASKERATHRLATPAKDQKGISQETEQSTPARPQKLSPLTQTDASSPALETHKPTQDTDKPFSRSASERRHRFYHIDSGTSTESATDHRQTFRSRDSEASIGSSIPPVESPSDSDSLASSIASDIVRGMSPRSLEILERKRKRKEEKKAARRRSALNTPERDAEGVSPGTESPEKSGDDSDGKQRFRERRNQLTPSSSYDELKKTDSVKPSQPVQELVEKQGDNKKLEAEIPTTTVEAGKRKEVPSPTKPTSPNETPASSAAKRDEPEQRKVVKDRETKQDSPAASAKPVKRQGQIAEGKQTKKLLQKFEKAATERKGPKVLAERVEESRVLLGQKAKGRTKSVDSEKELEKGKEPEKQKLQEQERGKDRVSAEEEKKQTETVKKTEITKDKETKEQKKEPVQTKTTVSAQKEEVVKTQRSKVDDKTKGSTRPRVRSPTKSAEPVKVRKQAENEQRRGSISSDSSASVKSTDSRPFSSRPSLKKREDKPRTVSPTKKESVGLPESGKTPRRPLSDSMSVNAKVDSKKMSRSATDPAIKSSRIEQRLQEKAEAKVRSSGRAVSPEKKVRKDTVQAKVDSGLKTEIPKNERKPGSRLGLRRTDSPLSSTDEESASLKKQPRRRPQIPTVLKEAETRRTSPEPWRRKTIGSDSSDSDGRRRKPLRSSGSEKEDLVKRREKQTPRIKESKSDDIISQKAKEGRKVRSNGKEAKSPTELTKKSEEAPRIIETTKKVNGAEIGKTKQEEKAVKRPTQVEHTPKIDEPSKVAPKSDNRALAMEKTPARVETKPKAVEDITKTQPRSEPTPVEKVVLKPLQHEVKPEADVKTETRPTHLEVKAPEKQPVLMKSPSFESTSDREVTKGLLSVERESKSSLRRTSSFKTSKEMEREVQKQQDTKRSALSTKDSQLLELMRARARKIEEQEDEEMLRKAEEELKIASETLEEMTAEQLVEKRIEKPKKLDISLWEKQTDDKPQARTRRVGRLRSQRGQTIDIGEVRLAAEEVAKEARPKVEESQPTQRKNVEQKQPEKGIEVLEGKPPVQPKTKVEVVEKSQETAPSVTAKVDRVRAREKERETKSAVENTTERFRTQPITRPEYVAAKEQVVPSDHATADDVTREDTTEDESAKDELSQMSVSEKRKLFLQLQQEKMKSPDTKRKPRRFQKRLRASERSQTQPVTQEEVKTAVTLADEEEDEKVKVKIAEEIEKAKEDEKEPDALSQLSLADKMKLFKEKSEAPPEKPPPKRAAPTRKKRQGSRFKTQPVTIEELQRAKKMSPLAISFSKPPDPELLATLPLSDQIALVYGDKGDSETTKPTEQQGTTTDTKKDQPKSVLRRSSVSSLENKGILKEHDKKEDKDRPKGILKSEKSEEREDLPKEVRSILKPERRDSEESVHDRVKGILKSERRSSGSEKEDSEKGILKKKDSVESPTEEGSPRRSVDQSKKPDKGVLKHRDSSSDAEKKEIVGVLKRKDSTEEKTEDKEESPSKTKARPEIAEARKSERFQTQPVESPETKTQKKRLSRKLSQDPERHKTQPITVQEVRAAKSIEAMKPSSSISDRLSALQQSGETDWKKRISKFDDTTFIRDIGGQNGVDDVKPREKSNGGGLPRPQSIAERLQQLQSCEVTWKGRVESHDAEQYTVTGKMSKAGKEVSAKQTTRRPRKARPLSGSFKLPPDATQDAKGKNEKMPAARLADKQREEVEMKIYGGSSSSTTTPSSSDITSESEAELQPTAIEILKPDNEDFAEFFKSTSVSSTTQRTSTSTKIVKTESTVEVSVSDFDVLTDVAKPTLGVVGQKRGLKPQRRTKASSNPLRALQARSDVKSEYTEIRTDVAIREVKRMKKEQIEKESTFASSALAGLASTEDFSSVSLRKTSEAASADASTQLLPFKELMLLHIKGRRNVQVRLVEPKASSLTSGDSYVLVTPKMVILWQGDFANVIEKAKAAEVSQVIQTKKDLGCKTQSVAIIDEEKGEFMGQYRNWRTFWQLLGGREKYKDVGPAEEDENYEVYIIEANMVYRVQNDSLVPYEEYWGAPPKVEMLDSSQVLVFDFGSEMYIWQGRQSSLQARKVGVQLAKQLWATGYDYSDCDINPLSPLDDSKPKKGQRPAWALFAKVNERMETVLFRNKFQDWPDDSRIIKVKSAESEKDQKSEIVEMKPYDAKIMVAPNKEKPYLVFEGVNVGRGTGLDSKERKEKQIAGYYDKIEKRGNVITTLSVVTWHVLEYEHSIVPKECFGQLHEGDTYVVRWQFRVEAAEMKDLKGNISKRAAGHGKEKCAYFFWQGSQSTINEKGASALMTVELDEERGPQVRVVQGKEPPVFLHLFQSSLIMHIGKREEEETNTQGNYRLYCVRGEETNEGFLIEVPREVQNLRSRMSLLLLNLEKIKRNQAEIVIWYGSKASPAHRKVAKITAQKLQENRPLEAGLNSEVKVSITEMEEGEESTLFWKAIGGKPGHRKEYDCLLEDPLKYDYTPRLFHLTSQSGVFEAIEILNPARSDKSTCSFPFLQSELYNVSQPAQFLLDNNSEVYLWQGWWPEDEEEAHYGTGSAKMKWDVDRKVAMETVMDYCKEKNPKSPLTAYIINAGLEPKTFTNLFPYWHCREDVEEINKKEGKSSDEIILVKDVLAQLTKSRYTLEELKERPLPEGVDPSKLEAYLSDEEFETILNMSKEEFYQLPSWKQNNLKKDVGLF